jgi:hypothetical protein
VVIGVGLAMSEVSPLCLSLQTDCCMPRTVAKGQKETWLGLDQSGLVPENLTTLAHLSIVRRQLQPFACYRASKSRSSSRIFVMPPSGHLHGL